MIRSSTGYKKRFFQAIIRYLLLASVIVLLQITVEDNVVKSQDKPNIIYIMVDDLGYGDLGSYGQKLIDTPNLDTLAREGIRFTQAYAGGPVCVPSRSAVMTGLHNGHAPARDNIPHYHTYLHESDTTTAEILHAQGYRTAGVGKWSLGNPGTVGRPTNQGFDTWFGYLNQDHAHYYYPDYLIKDGHKVSLGPNSITKNNYSHNLIRDQALKFIRNNRDRPFFLYAAFTLPHFAAQEEDEHGFTVPTTDPYSNKDWGEQSKKYAAMVNMIDRDVGKIVDLVDRLGMRKETLIIFTSDNGGHSTIWDKFNTNGPLRGHKRDLTEGGIRVPFIARWPGTVPQNKTTNEVISFQDMMPTFANLSGAETPNSIDGIDVTQALMGDELDTPHEYLYWDYGHTRDRYDQAVRMGKWKALRLGRDAEVKLYNLEMDISESTNVAHEYPDVVRHMKEIMRQAFTPSDRYPIGERYTGDPIWMKTGIH